jgi:hypothetical protein
MKNARVDWYPAGLTWVTSEDGPSAPNLTASDAHKRSGGGRRASDGGARRSAAVGTPTRLDFQLPVTKHDAVGLYAKLEMRGTHPRHLCGGSGNGESTAAATADGAWPASGGECCGSIGTRKERGSCCSPHDGGSEKQRATRMEQRRRSTPTDELRSWCDVARSGGGRRSSGHGIRRAGGVGGEGRREETEEMLTGDEGLWAAGNGATAGSLAVARVGERREDAGARLMGGQLGALGEL